MAVSQEKIEANRRNAMLSTGPRTEQGKAVSRLNSLKHGIFARETVNAVIEGDENRRLFEEMVERLGEEFQPDGCLEELMVQEIATCCWRLRRVLRFENRMAWTEEALNADRSQAAWIDGAGRVDGAGDFVRDRSATFKSAGLGGIALPHERHCQNIIRYENTVKRALYRALSNLEHLQRVRKAREFAQGLSPGPSIEAAIDRQEGER